MSALTQARPPESGLGVFERLGQVLAGLADSFVQAQAVSREARHLMNASERELAEKGLTHDTVGKHLFQKYFAKR